mgnify:CR=1 FL=1
MPKDAFLDTLCSWQKSFFLGDCVLRWLVFVTDYIPDKRRYIFLGGKPTLFKTRCKKKEVTEELKIQFCEMAQQYKKL